MNHGDVAEGSMRRRLETTVALMVTSCQSVAFAAS